MEAPAGRDPSTLKDAIAGAVQGDARGRPRPVRARPVRRLPRHRRRRRRTRRPRPTPRCAWRSTTGAGPACRSTCAPASACRSRRPSCGSCSSAPPRLGFHPRDARAHPSPTSSSSSSTRRPASGCSSRPARRRARRPSRSTSTWSSPRRAARARPRTRSCCTPRCSGDSMRFTRQDGVEEAWRIMAAAARRTRRPSSPTPRARGGPTPRTALVAGTGGWHGPWVGVMSATDATPNAARRPRDRHRARHRRPPQSAAAPSPFPPIADYGFLSNCHTGRPGRARRRDRLAVRADASTRRACSARCSTARPATSASGRSASTSRRAARYVPGHEHAR